MAALTGNSIDSSYQGLLKTTDNGAVGGASKAITDGLGNATNIEIGNAVTKFPSGTVDFTGSTVQGLPTGSAGLVTNGANGMMSDSSLTTNPAISTGTNSVVLGDNAKDEGNDNAIAIGLNARVREPGGIAIGANTEVYDDSVAIGNNAVSVFPGVSIGEGAKNFGTGNSVVIGHDNNCNYAKRIINIGGQTNTSSDNDDNIILGSTVTVAGNQAQRNIYIGNSTSSATNDVDDNILIGHGANTTGVNGGVALGSNASFTAEEAVAIGKDVVAATASTVSVKALETQTDGGVAIKGDGTNAGKLKLYCEDAAGTHNVTLEGPAHAGGSSYSLKLPNVQSAGSQILEADSSGNLSWINTPGGGGGAQGAYTPMNNSGMDGVIPYASATAGPNYRTTRLLSGTGLGQAYNPGTDSAYYELIAMQELSTISELVIEVDTAAAAGSTAEIAIYDTNILNGLVNGNTKLQSLGTIDTATTGQKVLTLGTPFAMPSGKTNGQVMIVVWPSDHNVRFKVGIP